MKRSVLVFSSWRGAVRRRGHPGESTFLSEKRGAILGGFLGVVFVIATSCKKKGELKNMFFWMATPLIGARHDG